MKKIAVVAANGKAGKLIVKEAIDRGMDVTAFVYRAPRGPLAVKNSVKRNPQRSVFFRCEVKGDLRSDLRFCCKVG